MKAIAVYAIFAVVFTVVYADDYKQLLKDSLKNCAAKFNVPKPSAVSGSDLNTYLKFAKDNPTLVSCFYDCTFKGAGLLGDSGFATDKLKNDLKVGKSSAPACVFAGDDIAKCADTANAVTPADPADPNCEKTQAFLKCFMTVKCTRP